MPDLNQKYELIKSLCNLRIKQTQSTINKVFQQIEKTALFYRVPLKKSKEKSTKTIDEFIVLVAQNNQGFQQLLPELHNKIKKLKL